MRLPSFSLATAAALVLAAGCSKQAANETPVKEVRGEPIAPATTAPAPAALAAGNAPAAKAPAAAAGDEFPAVGFDKLAGFTYDMPDESNVTTNAPAK